MRAHDRAALRRRHDAPALAANALLRQPRVLLITLLIGNMLTNVTYFVVSSVLLLRLDVSAGAGAALAPVVASLLVLLCIVLFGEVFPKLVAARLALTWVNISSAPLYAIHGVVRPIATVLSQVVILPLIRLLAPEAPPTQLDFDELDSLLRISADEGALTAGERELLSDVVGLGRRKVRDVMTPRVAMTAAELATPYDDAARMIRRSRERWIPIYRHNVDHIVGVLDARDFLYEEPPRIQRRGLREPTFIPELATLDHALDQLHRSSAKVAVVVDEFGQTAGVIKASDILRSLLRIDIGEVERREEDLVLTQIGRWEAPGSLSVRDFEQYFGVRFDEDLRVSTLAGFIVENLGRVAQVGDVIAVDGYRIVVKRMEHQRVVRVVVEMVAT